MLVMNDPIGDLLTRIRNAQAARRSSCEAPWSRIKEELCRLLVRDGWLSGVEVIGEEPFKVLLVSFTPGKRLTLKRVSKPGRRVYRGAAELRTVLRGFGASVLTTSRGLLTDDEAREQGIGGEVLCTIS